MQTPVNRSYRHGASQPLFAILGHIFPIWLKFKGGKGVATGVGFVSRACPQGSLDRVADLRCNRCRLALRFTRLHRATAAFPVFALLFYRSNDHACFCDHQPWARPLSSSPSTTRTSDACSLEPKTDSAARKAQAHERDRCHRRRRLGNRARHRPRTQRNASRFALGIRERSLRVNLSAWRESNSFCPACQSRSASPPPTISKKRCASAKIVVSVMPSHHTRRIFQQMAPHLASGDDVRQRHQGRRE